MEQFELKLLCFWIDKPFFTSQKISAVDVYEPGLIFRCLHQIRRGFATAWGGNIANRRATEEPSSGSVSPHDSYQR